MTLIMFILQVKPLDLRVGASKRICQTKQGSQESIWGPMKADEDRQASGEGMPLGTRTSIRQPDGSELTFDNTLSMQKLGRLPTDFELRVYKVQSPYFDWQHD